MPWCVVPTPDGSRARGAPSLVRGNALVESLYQHLLREVGVIMPFVRPHTCCAGKLPSLSHAHTTTAHQARPLAGHCTCPPRTDLHGPGQNNCETQLKLNGQQRNGPLPAQQLGIRRNCCVPYSTTHTASSPLLPSLPARGRVGRACRLLCSTRSTPPSCKQTPPTNP